MHFTIFVLSLVVPLSCITAFAPIVVPKTSTTTQLYSNARRDVLLSTTAGLFGLIIGPQMSSAKGSTFFYDDKIETVREESQMPTGGKVDLNSAFVGEYKQFPGMFPHAAGMIASHGPYTSVRDIYSIEGLTDNDKKLFKMYEKAFTTNPPGRSFKERINNRVST